MIPAIIIPAWPRALTLDQACAYASASPGNLLDAGESLGFKERSVWR